MSEILTRMTEAERAATFVADAKRGLARFGKFPGQDYRWADEGFVYFITIGEPAIWVKIGFTSGDPFARLKSLQTGCPYPMRMKGFVFGTMQFEQELHDVLSDDRGCGEWFLVSEYCDRIIDAELSSEVMSDG